MICFLLLYSYGSSLYLQIVVYPKYSNTEELSFMQIDDMQISLWFNIFHILVYLFDVHVHFKSGTKMYLCCFQCQLIVPSIVSWLLLCSIIVTVGIGWRFWPRNCCCRFGKIYLLENGDGGKPIWWASLLASALLFLVCLLPTENDTFLHLCIVHGYSADVLWWIIVLARLFFFLSPYVILGQ